MRILNQIKRKNLVETSVQTLARKRRTPILFFILPLPGLIALLMFSYLPMVGLYIVFERYTYQGGLFGSEFVGLKNFEFFFRNMSNALRATRNTLVINCFSILFGIAVNVALAIAVNEIRSVRFRKVTQSIMEYYKSTPVVHLRHEYCTEYPMFQKCSNGVEFYSLSEDEIREYLQRRI